MQPVKPDIHWQLLTSRDSSVRCLSQQLLEPLQWRTPSTVHIAGGDLFDPAVPFAFIKHVLSVMARCPEHDFLFTTDHPEQLQVFLSSFLAPNVKYGLLSFFWGEVPWPLQNLRGNGALVGLPDTLAATSAGPASLNEHSSLETGVSAEMEPAPHSISRSAWLVQTLSSVAVPQGRIAAGLCPA